MPKRKLDQNGEVRVIRQKGNEATKNNPLILFARQHLIMLANSGDIIFNICSVSEQNGGYYKYKGLQRNSQLEWEIEFVKKGKAVLTAKQGTKKLRDIFITINGYCDGQINRMTVKFDDKVDVQISCHSQFTIGTQDISAEANNINLSLETYQADFIDLGTSMQSDDMFIQMKVDEPPEIFRNEPTIYEEVKAYFDAFLQEYKEHTFEHWFWFSLNRAFKRLFFFVNYSDVKLLHQPNMYNELPLHIALKEEKSVEMLNLLIEMMDGEDLESKLTYCDAAGISPVYLIIERDLLDRISVKRVLHLGLRAFKLGPVNQAQHAWAKEQFLRYGNTFVRNYYLRIHHEKDLDWCDHTDIQADLSSYIVHWAVEFGVTVVLQQLAANGDNLVVADPNGEFPIHKAAALGHVDTVKFLLEHGCSVELLSSERKTALHYAADSGRVEVVLLLLEAHAKVDAVDNGGFQPIHYAARGGFSDIVLKLVACGAQVSAVGGKEGMQPVHCAASGGQIDTVHILLQLGANIDATDAIGKQLSHYALKLSSTFCNSYRKNNMGPETFRELLHLGVSYIRADSSGVQPLHTAAEFGRDHEIELLLNLKVPVDVRTHDHAQPIHYAAQCSPSTVELLLYNGAKFNAKTINGKMPIHFAAAVGEVATIDALVNHGATIYDTDVNGTQPIHLAAAFCERTLVHLIQLGAKIDARDFEGAQPIHYMARSGETHDLIPVLVGQGAKIDARDDRGVQPVHIAAQIGDGYTLEELINLGADPFAKTNNGMQPIHFAVANSAHELVEYLVELGADVNAKDHLGKSVVDYAGNTRTLNFLVDIGASLAGNAIEVEVDEGDTRSEQLDIEGDEDDNNDAWD